MCPTGGEARFQVDVDAISDFQTVFNRLDARASTAGAKVSPASAEGLGTFPEARTIITEHDQLRAQYQARLETLRAAVAAASQKTARVVANYRQTETGHTGNMSNMQAPLAGSPQPDRGE